MQARAVGAFGRTWIGDIVGIVRYEKSQESRLPVAVVRGLEGNEILRATVESQELVTV